VPDFPAFSPVNLVAVLPWYRRPSAPERDAVSRLPDDLPPEAVAEKQYCCKTQSALSSRFRSTSGYDLGGIGLHIVRRAARLPDDLVQSPSWSAEIFATPWHAAARTWRKRESDGRFRRCRHGSRPVWMSGPDKHRTYFKTSNWLGFTGRRTSARLVRVERGCPSGRLSALLDT